MRNEFEWGTDTLFVDLYNQIDSLNIYSNTSQNWNFHNEYIHSYINNQNNYISMGIKPDITLAYRGVELDKLDILFPISEGCKWGDFNHDGISNVLDIIGISYYIIGLDTITEFQRCTSDINNDTDIDLLDIITLLNIILEGE